MAINIIHHSTRAEEKVIGFPWLGVSAVGLVVLFNDFGVGTVIQKGESTEYSAGHYSMSWDMSCFKPLPEGDKIVLTNTWESPINE